jgi:hypothetical protein
MSRVDVATYLLNSLRPTPFTTLPPALFLGSLREPGARWCSIQEGAAIPSTGLYIECDHHQSQDNDNSPD